MGRFYNKLQEIILKSDLWNFGICQGKATMEIANVVKVIISKNFLYRSCKKT